MYPASRERVARWLSVLQPVQPGGQRPLDAAYLKALLHCERSHALIERVNLSGDAAYEGEDVIF